MAMSKMNNATQSNLQSSLLDKIQNLVNEISPKIKDYQDQPSTRSATKNIDLQKQIIGLINRIKLQISGQPSILPLAIAATVASEVERSGDVVADVKSPEQMDADIKSVAIATQIAIALQSAIANAT